MAGCSCAAGRTADWGLARSVAAAATTGRGSGPAAESAARIGRGVGSVGLAACHDGRGGRTGGGRLRYGGAGPKRRAGGPRRPAAGHHGSDEASAKAHPEEERHHASLRYEPSLGGLAGSGAPLKAPFGLNRTAVPNALKTRRKFRRQSLQSANSPASNRGPARLQPMTRLRGWTSRGSVWSGEDGDSSQWSGAGTTERSKVARSTRRFDSRRGESPGTDSTERSHRPQCWTNGFGKPIAGFSGPTEVS